jgi:sugar O-acyltransferase (sialic acid O-acetyltransferase NeuD family)
MSRLIIIGAGGHGKVVADAATEAGWREVVFLDSGWPEKGTHAGFPVVGTDRDLARLAGPEDQLVVSIGDGRRREQLCREASDAGIRLATVIHPAATVSKRAQIGAGTVVFAGALVNADARIGMGCIVNTGAIIEHDCELGDGVHVCPGVALAGAVIVGARSWIGIGGCVKQGIRIGADVMVGAGAVVVKDLPDGITAFGVPARVVGGHQK